MSPTPGSPTLVLVPTGLERARLIDDGGLPPGTCLTELCGFGPVAAAARTAQLLERLAPARVFLVGIAGSLDLERAPVGAACEPSEVAIEGIGVGEGARLVPPAALGFPQWPGRAADHAPDIQERLALASRARREGLLLTTCAASDSPEHAAARRERFPDAMAEDMEGFAVALACALASTPLCIVRGISNEAGRRDPATWRIPSALRAARLRLCELLEERA